MEEEVTPPDRAGVELRERVEMTNGPIDESFDCFHPRLNLIREFTGGIELKRPFFLVKVGELRPGKT